MTAITANEPNPTMDPSKEGSEKTTSSSSFVRSTVYKEISKQVIRRKLARQRHCIIEQAISPQYLDALFPQLLKLFHPQAVNYNGGIAGVKRWKISCYLEVMPGGVPTAEPHVPLLQVFQPLLDACNELFCHWYRQQHACNKGTDSTITSTTAESIECHRLMTFITRYTPQPGEEALLKVGGRCAAVTGDDSFFVVAIFVGSFCLFLSLMMIGLLTLTTTPFSYIILIHSLTHSFIHSF